MGTYVNNLRLLEITTGDESGTWGTKTNTNLELIADAFGSGTEAITTNADTHTTTIADGAADEGRALFLKYTGTLDSACTITIAPNTVNKLWFIENATSGSQNIIISQGSGANITIGNGKVAAVYTDGAGSGAAVLDVFADLEISSTLTVAGNVTMSADATVGDDLTLLSDAAVLGFGADTDVTLTHVADTGLLLNSTMAIQFNDASQYINAPSNAILDINATDEIELNATLADVNANLDVSGTIVGASTIEGTTITATTAFVPDASDGATLGSASLEFSDLFLADGAQIAFGDDQEVTLTHVADTGLLLSDDSGIGTTQLQFGDSGTYIHQSADGVLDLVADTEIEINATTIDINGAVDISGDTSIGTDFLTVADGITTIGGTDTSKLRFHNAAGTLRSFLTLNTTSLEIDTDSALIFSP
jgi:phage gp45-like